MGVSLGTRIAGLCLAGTVAVIAASCAAGEAGPPDRGVDVSPTGGLPEDGRDGTPHAAGGSSAPAPSWHPDGSGGPVGGPPAAGPPTAPPRAVPSPTPVPRSTDAPAKQPGPAPLTAPAWLPPGPVSPDTDAVPDPESLYDRLRTPATGCADVQRALPSLPPSEERRLLQGLADACLAVQGRGGSWEAAVLSTTSPAQRPDDCKGRAAHAVLSGLLDFHRRHPGATVRLEPAPASAPACSYAIAAVDAGPDGTAHPGEPVAVELRGTYFDHAELLADGTVSVGGVDAPGPLTALAADGGDRLRLTVTVPAVSAAPGTPLDVRVRYGGTEVARPDAFVLAAPAPPTPSASP
ncbi:hypothetical protein ACFW4M_16670 [Streptomyces sp. NPDC058794]|uniref:hypothetical protein n=1 Tax=unclassified Streptomyces TaxID=2593676 RepID=UPI0036AA6616